MFLSRVYVNSGPGATAVDDRLLRSSYLLHQAVFAAFDPDTRGARDVLYRREPELCGGCVALLVQSETQPDWERGFAADLTRARAAEVMPLRLNLKSGQRLRFRVRANPTRKIAALDAASQPKKNGKRVSLLTRGPHWEPVISRLVAEGITHPTTRQISEILLHNWLTERLHAAAEALDFQTVDEGLIEDREHHLSFKSVRFDGTLQVSDPDRMLELVRIGIGTAKGFGFGLLSLAAPR